MRKTQNTINKTIKKLIYEYINLKLYKIFFFFGNEKC